MCEWIEMLWRLLFGTAESGSGAEPDPTSNLGGEIIEDG